jgi:hypothetical protein
MPVTQQKGLARVDSLDLVFQVNVPLNAVALAVVNDHACIDIGTDRIRCCGVNAGRIDNAGRERVLPVQKIDSDNQTDWKAQLSCCRQTAYRIEDMSNAWCPASRFGLGIVHKIDGLLESSESIVEPSNSLALHFHPQSGGNVQSNFRPHGYDLRNREAGYPYFDQSVPVER